MKIKKLILIFLVCISQVYGSENIVHNVLHYPPYWSADESTITGYHAELSRIIYQEAKLDIDIIKVPYSRISNFKFNNDVAMVAYGKNPATDKLLLFPLPLTVIKLNIYSIKHAPPTEINKLKK